MPEREFADAMGIVEDVVNQLGYIRHRARDKCLECEVCGMPEGYVHEKDCILGRAETMLAKRKETECSGESAKVGAWRSVRDDPPALGVYVVVLQDDRAFVAYRDDSALWWVCNHDNDSLEAILFGLWTPIYAPMPSGQKL